MERYFFRNGICCLLTENPAGIWWGHLGLPPGHRYHGDGYVRLRPNSLSHTVIPPELAGKPTMEAKWWLGFEGSYSRQRTLDSLLLASDQLEGEKEG